MDRTRLAVAITGCLGVFSIGRARGHVKYVTDGSGEDKEPMQFLIEVLTDPLNAALVVGSGLLVIAAVLAYLQFRPAREDVAVARRTLGRYRDLVPWILRLSVGLPLVGAGFAGYFFSPAVAADVRVFQVVVGFLLLFGLASRIVAAVALLAYLSRLAFDPAMLLAFEFVGGLLGIVVLGSGRPSADQVLATVAAAEDTLYSHVDPFHGIAERANHHLAPYEDYAATAVRVALGVNFVILGLTQKLLRPAEALAVVEKYELTAVVPVDPGLWVVGAGLVEMTVGALLVLGLFTRGAAAVAFFMFTLTLVGLPDDPVLAHVSLFGLTSALLVTASGPLALDNLLQERRAEADSLAGEPVAGED